MFTGLVKDQGEIRRIEGREEVTVEILPSSNYFPLEIGASISCSGICLTVVAITKDRAFTATMSKETLDVTAAGKWKPGDILNLEPSLKVGDELGGHLVSGHVDGVAKAVIGKKAVNSTVWEFETTLKLIRFIAPKGSVALNGVSLTVNEVYGNRFTVNLIPLTAEMTNLGRLQPNDSVNLEIDTIARYVARIMEAKI